MPILNPDDGVIDKLSLFDESKIGTSLPNPLEAHATFTPIGMEAVQEAFGRDQIANWANGFQQLSGSVLQRVGAPQGDLSFGDDLFNGLLGYIKIPNPANAALAAMAMDAFDVFIDKALEAIAEVLVDVLSDVIDPLIQMVGSIPIYGWIIEAVWDIAFGIVKLVRMVKEQNADEPDKEYAAAAFSPDTDRAVARQMFRETRDSTDWTNVFRPEGINKNEGWYSANFFGAKLTGGVGYRITSAGHQEGWVGMIPGGTTLASGYEIYNQGPMQDRTLGQLFPSARYMGISIWDQINLKSPSMFCVDAVNLRTLWTGHLQQLREHLYEHDIPNRRQFVDGLGKDLFNWSSWDAGKVAYDKMWKDDGYDDWEPYQDDLGVTAKRANTPAANCDTLFKRQMAYLNTTACAYVDPKKYAAFTGNTGLQPDTQKLIDRIETNRNLLLQHAVRCSVDVSNIPDQSYRWSMETAQENCLPGYQGQLKMPDLGGGKEDPPPPVNQIPLGAKLRPLDPGDVKEHVRKGGKLTPLLLIAGAVGLVWAKKKGTI